MVRALRAHNLGATSRLPPGRTCLHDSRIPKRLVMYCQATSVSAAHATRCATYCTPCRPPIRAYSQRERPYALPHQKRTLHPHQPSEADQIDDVLEPFPWAARIRFRRRHPKNWRMHQHQLAHDLTGRASLTGSLGALVRVLRQGGMHQPRRGPPRRASGLIPEP